ncbi:hypothetical protein PQX77_006057 [Marasmius sp. AFHP31]|nr:hypothetical protein PQX77_006057 [Marasmius sp. AFHP31]
MSGVKAINSFEDFQNITGGDKPIVIDFWAPWCGPCKMISPIFEKFSQHPDYSDSVGFYKVDIDEQQEIASHMGLRAIPHFQAFKGGEKIGDPVAGANPQALQSLLTSAAA